MANKVRDFIGFFTILRGNFLMTSIGQESFFENVKAFGLKCQDEFLKRLDVLGRSFCLLEICFYGNLPSPSNVLIHSA